MVRDTTTVEVGTDTWSTLNAQKAPGDSFDDIIRRLLSLAGANIEQPEGDDDYVAGDVVLVEMDKHGKTVLTPSMLLRDKRADEPGDHEFVPLTRLKWGADSTRPRARSYLSDGVTRLNVNEGKVSQLDETPNLVQK